jgi:hypothetical protein
MLLHVSPWRQAFASPNVQGTRQKGVGLLTHKSPLSHALSEVALMPQGSPTWAISSVQEHRPVPLPVLKHARQFAGAKGLHAE